jgi:sugar lactone lactonase YvrE
MIPAIEILPIPPAALGEGPIWVPAEQAFYWLDITGRELHRLALPALQHSAIALPGMAGCLAPLAAGGLAVALPDGLHRLDPTSGALGFLMALDPKPAGRRSNDGAVDRQGRFWVSTVAREGAEAAPGGRVYLCDGAAAALRLAGLTMPNGLAAAPDGRILYVSDSAPAVRRIWAFDLEPERGALSNRRLLLDTAGRPGRPDGAAIDEDGGYWMAGVGGGELVRLTPAGRIDRVIELPVSHPTKPCFGGPGLELMLVTSADRMALAWPRRRAQAPGGSTLLLRPGVRGLAQLPYAGPQAALNASTSRRRRSGSDQ